MARKILLADDSVTAQNMGRRILTDAGYDVTTVNNGSAALKKIAESKPDLIVLDVYMPGYGGLEVCQRLRESQETARIPVLLTVGKLEPFKPEEARRVRADAFIVKPFEASELLTALTKLEDKIVPQPQAYKPGRLAKAIAALEESGNPSNDYGDPESGWKNRLKIPKPGARSEDPEPAEAAPAGTVSAGSATGPLPVAAQSPARPNAGLPGDITAAEMAAIEAAAAAFSEQGAEPGASLEAGRTAAEIAHTAAEVQSQAESVEQIAAPTPAPPDAVAEVPPEAPSVAAEMDQPVVEAASASVPSDSENSASGHQKLGAEEVAFALASLAPSNGHGLTASSEDLEATSVSAASEQFTGPRWIAESVTVSADEAVLVLEQEMQKALAAMAAIDAAPVSETSVAVESIPAATENSAPSLEVVEQISTQPDLGEPAETLMANEGQSIEESLHVPPEPTDAVAEPAALHEEVASQPQEEAAYAAAASASGSSDSSPAAEAIGRVGGNDGSENAHSVPSIAGSQRESELAAAWASWKQVRDSVTGPQFTSQLADAAAAGYNDSSREGQNSSPEGSPSGNEESGAIASIVDSVLAELKPKLVQEIAKKMGKDKKS